jgi:hypothetical protein
VRWKKTLDAAENGVFDRRIGVVVVAAAAVVAFFQPCGARHLLCSAQCALDRRVSSIPQRQVSVLATQREHQNQRSCLRDSNLMKVGQQGLRIAVGGETTGMGSFGHVRNLNSMIVE